MRRGLRLMVVVLLVFTTGLLFAGGKEEEPDQEKEPVRLIIFSDIMAPVFDSLFERFTADTGYPMEIEALPGGQDYYNIVNSRLLSGEVPEIIINHGTPVNYAQMNPKQNLVDLTNWTAENITGKLLSEDLVKAQALEGRTYGIPFTGVTVRSFFYNKNVMKAAGVDIPKSFNDFYENVAPKIKAAGFIPIYGMGGDKWAIGFEAENYVGDQMVTTDIQDRIKAGEANLLDTDFLGAYEMQKKLVEAGFYNDDVVVGSYDGAVEALANDKAFMTCLSVVSSTRFTDEELEKLGGFGLSKDSNRIYYGLPNYAYIPKAAKNMEGARAFLDWFIEQENLITYYNELKMIPPYLGIESDMYTVAADFKKYFNAIPPFCPTLMAGYGMVGNYSSQVVALTKTPMEALEEMNKFYQTSAETQGLLYKK